MKKPKLHVVALLALSGLIGVSSLGVYGLTSAKSAGQIDAIASASKSSKSSNTSTTKSSTNSTTKTTVKPVTVPLPVPATPVPVVAPVVVPVPALPTVKETALNLLVFGKAVDLSGAPIIQTMDGKTMLPLRKLGEAMGYTVKWDNTERAAILQKNTETIMIKKDSLDCTLGTFPHTFSKMPEFFKERLYVPVDFITANAAYRLNQTAASISVDSSENLITGVIDEVTVFSNGLGLKVSESKDRSLTLFVTTETKVTDYSTGASLDKALLVVGAKAIFSYTAVPGEGQSTYNILRSVEVVQPVKVVSPSTDSTSSQSTYVDDDEEDEEDDD